MKGKCDVCDEGINMPSRYHGLDCPKRKGVTRVPVKQVRSTPVLRKLMAALSGRVNTVKVAKRSATSSKARSADLSGRYAQGGGEGNEPTGYVKLSVPTLMLTIKRLEEARETAQVVFSATKRRKEAKKIDLVLSRLRGALADHEADKRGDVPWSEEVSICFASGLYKGGPALCILNKGHVGKHRYAGEKY